MWLLSCRRQGMLIQGPAPDPKCNLNISSFLNTSTLIRLPHLYQEFCVHFIFIRNGGGDGISGGWLIYNRMWEGGQGVGIILQVLFFFLSLVLLLFILSCPLSLYFKRLEHDSCCVFLCFFVFFFFVSGPFN